MAVLVCYFVFIQTSWGQKLDERTLLGGEVISQLRAAQADRFLRIVSVSTLTLAMALVAVVAFLRGRPRMALIAAASVGGAVLVTEVLKLVILTRPTLVPSGLSEAGNSYPSGHTTVGMSVCLAALLVVPTRLRFPTALAAGAIGGAFGVAVVAAGWHRPSDAAGAYFVCLAVAALAAVAIRRWPDVDPRRRGGNQVPGPFKIGPTELALVGIAVALSVVFGLAVISARDIPLFSAGTAFLLASATLVALSFVCSCLLAWAMNDADREALPPAAYWVRPRIS